MAQHELQAVVTNLETHDRLTPRERNAVLDLKVSVRLFPQEQDIVREFDKPSQCCSILEGTCARYKLGADGRRQVLSFHHRGDIPDLQSLHLQTMDHNIGTLTPCRLAFITHDDLRDLIRAHPRIGDLFWRGTLIDSCIFRQWMYGMGQRSALERVAHLFCELYERMKALGLVAGDTCSLPITQSTLADALGLSTVHINRTVKNLRERGLVHIQAREMVIEDMAGLKGVAQFDATYLHLRGRVH